MTLAFEKDKLKLWGLIWGLFSVPNFYIFWNFYRATSISILAMIIGVIILIFSYTVVTSGIFFEEIRGRYFLSKALRISFTFKVFCSFIVVIYLIISNMSAFIKEAFEPVFILCLPEFISIIYSLEITELVLGEKRLNFSLIDGVRNKDIDFFTALFATITQGILLSLIIFLFAIIIWFFLRIVNLTLKRMGIKNERTN